uniref:Uncharacterized protein n=1 Tax=Utricularia reniformis TaxID=192314 RepID=A0A1Y0AYR2_9LAMI|nr:hypothetical protein AEK19_MT0452 [Utricularia reniformis]ART30288.1 hypothetical protein AEK19_MT0452 [Utricularia reniformis]
MLTSLGEDVREQAGEEGPGRSQEPSGHPVSDEIAPEVPGPSAASIEVLDESPERVVASEKSPEVCPEVSRIRLFCSPSKARSTDYLNFRIDFFYVLFDASVLTYALLWYCIS